MASCAFCKKEIQRGGEMQKMVTEFKYKDGHSDFTIPSEGRKAESGGQLFHVYHYKHFKLLEKRENRGGDALTGRGIGAVPTAYEITAMTGNKDDMAQLGMSEEEMRSHTTSELSERVNARRVQSLEAGTGAGDWRENERLRAVEHGGPYYHTHVGRVEGFRLTAHLTHAHGMDFSPAPRGAEKAWRAEELVQRHQEYHAALELERTRASRAQDPGYKEPAESDWRDQTVVEVGDVPGGLSPM